MKNLITIEKLCLTAGLFLVLLAGCDDDDDNVRDTESMLIGVWTVEDSDFDGSVDGKPVMDYFMNEGGLSSEDASIAVALFETLIKTSLTGTIEFKSDNTFVANFGDESEDGLWELSSDNETLFLDPGGPDELMLQITTLTENSLNFEFSEITFEDLDNDQDTPDVEVMLDISMELTK